MTLALDSSPATPAQLDWLARELKTWRADGLLGDDQADRILHRYHASRRFSLGRLLLALGGTFIGVGLLWLVAANLEGLPPITRLLTVSALWLALFGTAETLHSRGQSAPLVGALRIAATLAFGAVLFQAAQSLQVPAYEPRLVGLWALGALVYAYAVSARGPLIIAIAAGTGWYLWQTIAETPEAITGVLALGVLTVTAISAAALHHDGAHSFAGPWRALGALFGLITLFVAALPVVEFEEVGLGLSMYAGFGVSGLLAVAAVLRTRGTVRHEPLGALAVVALATALVAWEAGQEATSVTWADWAHAGVSVAAYVLVAVGVAMLGTLRDSWVLTALATAALVVFTTVQSFAVFAQIIQGAWLFVFLGLVFLGTGFLFDRARRELTATLEGNVR